ncbi:MULTISPECIES: hypothetical protein [Pseudomonas]|uniref:hypothetical protein n=1 Tax=Pseudomonas TaxID=286 RepID=UPI000A3A23E9|nr:MULTISPECIES: hypothetical protein [Pseudomonas]MBI6950939.1 hypothetical protein [Pseudomonas koreensis]QXZ15288.1 hypothetical protein KVQ82_05020 [Pseudomonas sp. AO-1]
MLLLPDFAALIFKVGAAEGCDLLILVLKSKFKRSQPSAAPTQDVFYRWEIIGCMTAHSNLKCTSRLVLRAIIEHYGVSTN